MSLRLRKSDQFIADFDLQFRRYEREAGWEVANRYLSAVDGTLGKLIVAPGIGHPRRFPQAELRGLYSLAVQRPFHRHLIFYRLTGESLEAWRIVHGARDLPRRLREAPEP